MANNFVFNDSLPVAPLKLAALESCRDFASKVNDHIVQFRRNDIEELTRPIITILPMFVNGNFPMYFSVKSL